MSSRVLLISNTGLLKWPRVLLILLIKRDVIPGHFKALDGLMAVTVTISSLSPHADCAAVVAGLMAKRVGI